MQQILVYGDSLSWGIIPGTRKRLEFEKRWPGVMENDLRDQGKWFRVVEDCLNGRRTVWEDPFKPGRNGLIGLEQRIEINSPLSLVIVLLGVNDFQSVHQFNAAQSAQGIATLISAIRRAPIEPGMLIPEILLVAPPAIQAKGSMAPKFIYAAEKSAGLTAAIQETAVAADCSFFDAGSVVEASTIDGVHLDEDQHRTLGLAIAKEVVQVLE